MKKSIFLYGASLLALILIIMLIVALSKSDQFFEGTSKRQFYVLAVSWQPAFCEKLPNRPECRSQRAGRFDASAFSLHGLWPQPSGNTYCNVPSDLVQKDKSRRWSELPKLDLSASLRKELAKKMPGYRSFLHRHEWYKHGVCMPDLTAEEYFRISLNLLDGLNASEVRTLMIQNIGLQLESRQLKAAFVRAFGKEADQRVTVDCYRDDGRRLIQELKIHLAGNMDTIRELKQAILEGEKVGRSCPVGIVDPVGLQ
ncbi:MAG: ribonuclease [Pseudomonadota bacterium]